MRRKLFICDEKRDKVTSSTHQGDDNTDFDEKRDKYKWRGYIDTSKKCGKAVVLICSFFFFDQEK